jgi:hypothetical protein
MKPKICPTHRTSSNYRILKTVASAFPEKFFRRKYEWLRIAALPAL